MTSLKSDFLHELKARGFIHQVTDEARLDSLLGKERVTGYIGFD
ncbi:MAG TPA: tyrosine--tRNA ligase, partial [Methyloceanibacter sp.]|nr:tyrosine--tRNA ligase [Methyloceanibacter sp.]